MNKNKKRLIALALVAYAMLSTSTVYASDDIENADKIDDFNELFTVQDEENEFNLRDYELPKCSINQNNEVVYEAPEGYTLVHNKYGFTICIKSYLVSQTDTDIVRTLKYI